MRLTKTRSDAAAAVKGGHVTVNGAAVKPATKILIGDRVEALLNRRQRAVIVRRLLSKRVGAAVAVECYEDHSPAPPERDEFEAVFAQRDRGTGRPTKRDRRQIDRLRGRSR